MGDGDSPVVQRRRVAKELRQLRVDRGMTVGEVAAKMECSPGKVSRIETASVGARLADVREMLDIYRVHGPDRDRILDLVRQSRRRTFWWHEYAGVLPPESTRFLGLEDGAAGVDVYSGNLVPGLLQTDAYGRALIATARDGVTTTVGDAAKTVDLRVELRAARQRLLTRADAPSFRFVVNEAALAVRFGGPEVMADQLDRLARVADRPNVAVRVLPLDTAAFAAAGGSFTIFTFADSETDPPIVFVENRTFSTYREGKSEVDVYAGDFAELLSTALPARRSRQVIKHWATVHHEAALSAQPSSRKPASHGT